ncbi:MAG: hypothetical protein AAFR11_11430 [Pseudomonadota bacterium]
MRQAWANGLKRRWRGLRRAAAVRAGRWNLALAGRPKLRFGLYGAVLGAVHLALFGLLIAAFRVEVFPPAEIVIVEFYTPPRAAPAEIAEPDEAEAELGAADAELGEGVEREEEEEDPDLLPKDADPPARSTFSLEGLPVPSNVQVRSAIQGIVCYRVASGDVAEIYCPRYDAEARRRNAWRREIADVRRSRTNPTLDEAIGPPVPQAVRDAEAYARAGREVRGVDTVIAGQDDQIRNTAGLDPSPVPGAGAIPTPTWARDRAEAERLERLRKELEEAEDEDG